jgi:hypothetical protein
MAKILKLPTPIKNDGKELTPEEIESFSNEPEYVEVVVERNNVTGTFFVGCDFETIDRDSERGYQRFKAKQLAAFSKMGDDNNTSEEAGIKAVKEAAELQDEMLTVFVDLAFPKGDKPFILGHNVPDMPEGADELKSWFVLGSPLARTVVMAIIGKYDPTSPLAFINRSLKKALGKATTDNQSQTLQSADSGTVSEEAPNSSETTSPVTDATEGQSGAAATTTTTAS